MSVLEKLEVHLRPSRPSGTYRCLQHSTIKADDKHDGQVLNSQIPPTTTFLVLDVNCYGGVSAGDDGRRGKHVFR